MFAVLAASMPGLLCLPDEVLKHILTHVPLKDRLGSCCLVHSRLHAAAVAVTQQVQIGDCFTLLAGEQAQPVLSWLSLYGQHVTHLELWHSRAWSLAQLPCCPNLVDLRLRRGFIKLGHTADGQAGMLHGFTKLTRLDLCPIDSNVDVDSLSSLVHLQHLDLTAELSAATLPRLQHLTHLTNHRMSLENLCQLGVLTALQELHCMAVSHIQDSPSSVTGLAVLPASLTKLDLTTNSDKGVEVALLPHVPTGLRALSITFSSTEAREPVLSCMARLQRLTELSVAAWSEVDWPPPGPAYSALTASSSLVSLVVMADLPAGVWPYVFRTTHQLPHLTCLAFDDGWDESDVPRWAFGATDLAALVSCCPGVCDVYDMCLQPGPHVSELCKLTALTKLSAYCTDGDPVGTVEGLAAITQLRSLNVHLTDEDDPLTVASLLPLTSLTRLTSLRMRHDNSRPAYTSITQAGSSPDVWLQLLEACAAADPGCQPTALRCLAQQLAEQRTLTAAQAEQIAGLQAQLLAQQQGYGVLQQQHAAVQQQVSEHREQLAAQQQAAAEQGARMAALEGSLQQLLQRLP